MKKNFLRNILLLAGSLLTVALAGCDEGENTYEYWVQNQTQKVICIEYELHDSPKIEYDTLQPGGNALIYTREEVSGDDIWDIESGSMMFAIRRLDVSINDSIYTEIYNGLPSQNPEGYDNNSPINFADRLSDKTRLLIIHGTADDNVHFQNTIEMCRALNRSAKQYDMMVYPDQNHSMMPSATTLIRQKMVDYTVENL
mgnify:CR=1 FL=1